MRDLILIENRLPVVPTLRPLPGDQRFVIGAQSPSLAGIGRAGCPNQFERFANPQIGGQQVALFIAIVVDEQPRIDERLLSDLPIGSSSFDASLEYARRIPVAVMAQWLGLPDVDHELILGFVHDLLEIVAEDPTAQQPGRDRLDRYLEAQIASRRARPSDDLISYLLSATIEGRGLSDSH
ncbi:MAG: hypothetical protein EBZ36_16790, partial [Acidobacteria bacterium]|nr:hypothetical protein [Acidobacteriota bacterium]